MKELQKMKNSLLIVMGFLSAPALALDIQIANAVATVNAIENAELQESHAQEIFNGNVWKIVKTGGGTLYNTNGVLAAFSGMIVVDEGEMIVKSRRDLGTNGTGGENDLTVVNGGKLTVNIDSIEPDDHEFGTSGGAVETFVIAGNDALTFRSARKEQVNGKETTDNEIRNLKIVLSGDAKLTIANGCLYPQKTLTPHTGGIDFQAYTLTQAGGGILMFRGEMNSSGVTGEGQTAGGGTLRIQNGSSFRITSEDYSFKAGSGALTIDASGSESVSSIYKNQTIVQQFMFRSRGCIPEEYKDLIKIKFNNYGAMRMWEMVERKDSIAGRFLPIYGDIENSGNELHLLVNSCRGYSPAGSNNATEYYSFDALLNGSISGPGDIYFPTVKHWMYDETVGKSASVAKGGILNLAGANTMTGNIFISTNNTLNVAHNRAVETFESINLTNAVVTVSSNLTGEVILPKVYSYNDQDVITNRIPTNRVWSTKALWYMENKVYSAGIANESAAEVAVCGLEKTGPGVMSLALKKLARAEAPTKGVTFTDTVEVKEGTLVLENGAPGWLESVMYGVKSDDGISKSGATIEFFREMMAMTNTCLFPRALYGENFAAGYVGLPGYKYGSSGKNTLLQPQNTLVKYDGYLCNSSTTNETWRFVSFHRTRARVYFDGVQIIYQTGQSDLTIVEVLVTPGWHLVEFIGHNDSSSSNGGPSPWINESNARQVATANTWWKNCLKMDDTGAFKTEVTRDNFAFAYDPTGKHLDNTETMVDEDGDTINVYSNHTSFVTLFDEGDAKRIKTAHYGVNNPARSLPKLHVSAGAKVDMNGAAYQMEELLNDGVIENGTVVVAGTLKVNSGGCRINGGKLILAAGSQIEVLGAPQNHSELITAEGGIEAPGPIGLKNLGEEWKCKISGTKLMLMHRKGVAVFVR